MQNERQTQEDGQKESVASPMPEFEEWTNFVDDDIMQQQFTIQSKEAKKIPFVGDKASPNVQTQEDGQKESVASPTPEFEEWTNFVDDDIMQQQSTIQSEEAKKIPFVGDKEPISSLAAEYESGSPILLEKIKVLDGQYSAIRRTRGDGNCFFRSFMFSYLEHILECQDQAEVERIKVNVEECRKTLQKLGYADLTFEDFFALFLEQLECVIQGKETSISHAELVLRCRDQSISDYVVMFFRFVTAGEIQKRSEFFEPFILGLTNSTVEQFCKSSVEPMGEESDHIHITALSDALGIPVRVMYLDRSSCDNGGVSVNHHDFMPVAGDLTHASCKSETNDPFITLLYRPGHYDILYPK